MTERVTLGSTIPVVQFGNLQASVEGEGETYEEAMDVALRRMQYVWNRTAEKPLNIDKQWVSPESTVKILTCRVSGAQVKFDTVAHTYTDLQGRKLMGGSTFAGKFKAGFPGPHIAQKMAVKHGVSADEIQAMWALNAEASSSFGTALHAALELYGKYLELSKKVKDGSDESALTKNVVLRPIVEAFYTDERKAETSYLEEFVADAKTLRCGLIDRLKVEPDGLTICDFKSNTDLEKPVKILPPFKGVVPDTSLGSYWLQLSYYGSILAAHGRVVKGLTIHHWTGKEWVDHHHPMVDLTPGFEAL